MGWFTLPLSLLPWLLDFQPAQVPLAQALWDSTTLSPSLSRLLPLSLDPLSPEDEAKAEGKQGHGASSRNCSYDRTGPGFRFICWKFELCVSSSSNTWHVPTGHFLLSPPSVSIATLHLGLSHVTFHCPGDPEAAPSPGLRTEDLKPPAAPFGVLIALPHQPHLSGAVMSWIVSSTKVICWRPSLLVYPSTQNLNMGPYLETGSLQR